ncbi:putative proteasome-type protease [Novimethylophilus kurashikiensis]|uniref:Putative proteasome-type protease n=1 Tax=Novimethylophilus kurashikiensis TaxID=1825523 RepID=A0A2R5F5K7_9PROT|nr:proteasome-type protease [Novimethylophilus kurashikiensis]GBG13199.1 putative proteasome-type protease [Novimethylophilus kurashikiensis]
MTYCVGLLLERGLVMASDSRTNAGVDHVSTFPKMTVFSQPDERVLVMMTSGNLAISQAVVSRLQNALTENAEPNLYSVTNMFDAARAVGDAVRAVHQEDAEHLRKHQADFNQAIILGGQIKGEKPRLFNIYAAGNFIEAVAETPYFQIGETKYGKPILDRVINSSSSLAEAAKCVLVSFDSTIRSNLSVGMPIDLMTYPADSYRTDCIQRITEGDPYFRQLQQSWSEGLRRVFSEIPSPDWCK